MKKLLLALAATLGAVFGVFAWGRLRARPAS